MESVHVLVDLANQPSLRGIYRPNERVVGARLDELLECVEIKMLAQTDTPMLELNFRLYDGWFDETGRGTELHGMVRAHVRNYYPKRQRRNRSFVTVADATLAATGERLIHTLREERGIAKYAVSVQNSGAARCHNPSGCGIDALRAWLKGRCSQAGCLVSAEEVAMYRQQKLVDTSIVSDAIWLASQRNDIAIMSDDEDVIPGLVTARAFGSRVVWICRASAPRPAYAGIIANKGIGYLQC